MTTIPAIKVLLALAGLGVHCVVSERNYPPLKPLGLPWRVLRRLTYPWADLHLVQTEVVGRWLSRHVAAEPQLLLPNPVIWPLPDVEPHLDPQEWLEQAGVLADDPVLMAVGTKAWQKGFDRLVDWFRELSPRHPRLQLVIVGLAAGEYHGRDQQQDLRQRLLLDPSLRNRLHFPGPVGNLQQWYERSQLFVLSSRYEGFPNVLLEAMASGCCCIAADCPQGPAELIKDGVNGRLIPDQASPQIWVEVIDGLLLRPFQRQRFATAAQEVRQRYEPAQLARSFVDAMESLRR
jgi:glycosyltransferase involved in cell wall biosynthesis